MVLLSPFTIVLPVAPGTVGFSYAGVVAVTENRLPVVNAGSEACSDPYVGVATGACPPPELPGLLSCAHVAAMGVMDSATVRIEGKKTFIKHCSW